VQRASHK